MKKHYAVYKLPNQFDVIGLNKAPLRDDFESEESAWEWIENKSINHNEDTGRYTVVPYISKMI